MVALVVWAQVVAAEDAKKSAAIAKEALVTKRSVYQLVLEKNLLTQAQLDDILKPENMTHPRKSISHA